MRSILMLTKNLHEQGYIREREARLRELQDLPRVTQPWYQTWLCLLPRSTLLMTI